MSLSVCFCLMRKCEIFFVKAGSRGKEIGNKQTKQNDIVTKDMCMFLTLNKYR